MDVEELYERVVSIKHALTGLKLDYVLQLSLKSLSARAERDDFLDRFKGIEIVKKELLKRGMPDSLKEELDALRWHRAGYPSAGRVNKKGPIFGTA